MNFDIVLRDDQYWLEGHPEGAFGPYSTKAEANEDRAGLVRFYTKHVHEKPTYVPTPTLRPEPAPQPAPKRTRKKK